MKPVKATYRVFKSSKGSELHFRASIEYDDGTVKIDERSDEPSADDPEWKLDRMIEQPVRGYEVCDRRVMSAEYLKHL